MTGLFDTIVIVDWSASARPTPKRPSADAIWIGTASDGGETTTYCRTRAAAEAMLVTLLDAEAAAGRRVLAGFDFPFGYPEGFAHRLTGSPRAGAVWNWLERNLRDGPDNSNTRFPLAASINASFGGRGPFWGRPRHLVLPHLPETKDVDYAALGLAERRRVEGAVPRAQPVWKLYTTGSVGGQALTGLPVIARLARRPGCAVWPFDAPTAPACSRRSLPVPDRPGAGAPALRHQGRGASPPACPRALPHVAGRIAVRDAAPARLTGQAAPKKDGSSAPVPPRPCWRPLG